MTAAFNYFGLIPTSVDDRVVEIPTAFNLEQNFPNPFNPETNIRFSIPIESDVRVTVFDVLGSEVAQLINEKMTPGTYTVNFKVNNISSGIYFYRFESRDFIQTKKMIYLR
jgi:hypothetical protein